MTRVKALLAQKKGETLMEGIVSLFVLAVLLAAVTLMLNFSMRVSGGAEESAGFWQDTANDLISETVEYSTSSSLLKLTITTGTTTSLDGIEVYTTAEGSDMFAFIPKP